MAASAHKRPTVRVGALLVDEGRLLLVQQARGSERYWLLPGGGLTAGETLADCARRELREELHLDIAPGTPLALVESISPDLIAYPKHVLHVLLSATVKPDSRVLRAGNLPTYDRAVLRAQLFTADELAALDLRPPIAEFLCACLEKLPEQLAYLGRRW